MAETFAGTVSITPEGGGTATIVIDGDSGDVSVGGGDGLDGELVLRDATGQPRITLDSTTTTMRFFDSAGDEFVNMGAAGNLVLGGPGIPGDLILRDAAGQPRISLESAIHRLSFRDAGGNELLVVGPGGDIVMGGAGGQDGDLVLKDTAGQTRVEINAQAHRMRFRDATGAMVFEVGPNGNATLGGAGGHDGDLTLKDGTGQSRLTLDAQNHRMLFFDAAGNQLLNLGPNGNIVMGGAGGADGDLTLMDAAGQARLTLDAQNHRMRFRDAGGNIVLDLGPNGNMVMGGAGGADGDLALKDGEGQTRINLDAQNHQMLFFDAAGNQLLNLGPNGNMVMGGAGGADGDLALKDGEGQTRINLDAQNHQMLFFDAGGNQLLNLGPNGNIVMGGAGGADGDLTLMDADGQARLTLDAQNHRMLFRDAGGNIVLDLGPNGNIVMGGAGGADGDLALKDGEGQTRINLDAQNHQMLFFDAAGNQLLNLGPNGNIVLGGAGGADGDLVLKDANNIDRITLDAQNHHITLRDEAGQDIGRIGQNANIKLGAGGHDGDILLFPSSAANLDDDSRATIHLDANAGDITLRNADCAEEFEIEPSVDAAPGTVMALGPDGRLRPSQRPHEKAVVGVVSGAGKYRPGIVLDRQPGPGLRRPIALMGKAFVRVTDEAGPIEIGDLLTASSTPGVAMKADDPLRAFGAVIGKAIAPHRKGEGMIPMIIALQ